MVNEYFMEEALNFVRKEMTMSDIKQKIEAKEELTEEQKKIFLQSVYRNIMDSMDDDCEKLKKSHVFAIKCISIVGKIGGKRTKAFARTINNMSNILKMKRHNTQEILRGIKITSNKMTPENFQTLLKQTEEMEVYEEAFKSYNDKYFKCAEDYAPDYTKIDTEDVETMTRSKTKIKELSKKYQK